MSQIVDGKGIAEKIYGELAARVRAAGVSPSLSVIYVGHDAATDSFVSIKQKMGEMIGVKVEIFRFADSASQIEVEEKVRELAASHSSAGIIIQLPLPKSFDAQSLLNMIPVELDVDVLSDAAFHLFEKGELTRMPTVAAAVKEILETYDIDLHSKKIAVVGTGKLVGGPIISWLKSQGLNPDTFGKHDDLGKLKDADVVISGTGVPGLIKPSMLKDSVVLIDAGTSEAAGKISGDADPSCSEKSSLFSPVPGGVGPVTVAMLFKNLIDSIRV